MISERTVSRLAVYRRLLNLLMEQGADSVRSRELAALAKVTAAQVRRDLMALGNPGSPPHGYDVAQLLKGLRTFLDTKDAQGIALAGLGNLGQAILSYFAGRRPKLAIRAAFDVDPAKTRNMRSDCACYPIEDMERVVRENEIRLGIIAVPSRAAQDVAERLARAGVRGIVNFAPMPLRLPDRIYVENVDITTALEKVAFFAARGARRRKMVD